MFLLILIFFKIVNKIKTNLYLMFFCFCITVLVFISYFSQSIRLTSLVYFELIVMCLIRCQLFDYELKFKFIFT